jgi:hypothetical protein
MIQFFQTVMGRKLIESDVPRIAKALERIADALEKQAAPAPWQENTPRLPTFDRPAHAPGEE